jgi:hypothetical protein
MESLAASLSRWKVIFWRRPSSDPAAEGFLYLWPEVRRLLLLDRSGSAVAGRFLNRGESISPGSEIDLPGHGVHVGERDLLPPPEVVPQPSATPSVGEVTSIPGLDLKPGLDIQKQIWHEFFCPMAFSPDSSSREFFLVASFGRSKHRLDCDSVSAMLSACLGGIPKDFNVCHLRDRTFRFSVFSKQVGFFINQLRSYRCSDFMVYFLLWGNGGPNFIREYSLWQMDEERSWQSSSKSLRR